ncbi:hypothetical protein ACFWP7_25820 [Streptomyces sp. NPDC058470]|uniref:hypothetical protein n=1 Tax=Streptomyces sp. NPDC058470 TaxID=3346515 RepID=UPI0036618927
MVVTGADGQRRPYRETGHHRELARVFGTVTVERCAWRQKGLPSVHPSDRSLSLPACRHSHRLRRLAVAEAVRGSYDQAKAAIDQRYGKVLGKRQVEHLIIAARDIDAFYRQQIPLPTTADTLLVLQFDGKGILMRPEALLPATLKAHRAARGDAHPARPAREAAPQTDGHPDLRLRRRSGTQPAPRRHWV